MSKRNKVLILVGFAFSFFLGLGFSEEKVVEVVKVDEQRESTWQNLKEIDEKAFAYASSGFSLCSNMIEAASDYDYIGLAVATKQMDKITSEMLVLNNNRQQVLQRLGF